MEQRKAGQIESKYRNVFKSIIILAVAFLALNSCIPTKSISPEIQNITDDPVVFAVGDIVCDDKIPSKNTCQDTAVAEVIKNQEQADAVLLLGDICHDPEKKCYETIFDSSWGQFKKISHPVPGNHDYYNPNATNYFDYFNGEGNQTGPAGNRDGGYYSVDLGDWHLVAINSQCDQIGGCNIDSPQYQWLQKDLEDHDNKCTLAFFHKPVFSAGNQGGSPEMLPLFSLMYTEGVDLVISGHDHDFEVIGPIDSQGPFDPLNGLFEFVVGTGGANHLPFIANLQDITKVKNNNTFGVLKLTLHPERFDWGFIPIQGEKFAASGIANCH